MAASPQTTPGSASTPLHFRNAGMPHSQGASRTLSG